jgi:hypothetical protein
MSAFYQSLTPPTSLGLLTWLCGDLRSSGAVALRKMVCRLPTNEGQSFARFKAIDALGAARSPPPSQYPTGNCVVPHNSSGVNCRSRHSRWVTEPSTDPRRRRTIGRARSAVPCRTRRRRDSACR